MSVYYVSDLHLISASQEKTKLFIKFLQAVPIPNDTLILGGDIFDLFVGNKKLFLEEFHEVLSAIKELANKPVKVFYLEGNHDFHLKNALPRNEQIVVDEERFSIPFNGVKIYVEHGDLIDSKDYRYRFLRFILRSIPFKVLLFLIPGRLVRKIGDWLSKKSRKYTDGINEKNNRTNHTRKLFRDFAKTKISEGMDIVLLGHSHLEDNLELETENGAKGTYINLGFSDSAIPYLRLGGNSRNNLEIIRQRFS